MATEFRKTGISVVGDMPWGTHFCYFYETKQDLLDILVPYFKAGLENNEFCLWVISEPLTEEEARSALQRAVPDLDRYLAERSIEILPYDAWYRTEGAFDLHRVINGCKEKLDQALARGYAGLRVTGDTSWIHKHDWEDFSAYEKELSDSIANQRMLVFCTYPLVASGAAEILDMACIHQIAVARRSGNWEVVETPALKQAKEEIRRLNAELEQRVVARTRQLATANEALRQEIAERQQAEAERARLFEQVRASHEQLQSLSRQLLQAQEAERRAIARKLHDEIGQLLTNVGLMLTTSQQLPPDLARARLAEAQSLVHDLIERVRNLAMDLRPATLDDLGLVPALVWLSERYTMQTNVSVRFEHAGLEEKRVALEAKTAAYRIVQEALTNVARHAGVSEVTVRLWTAPDTLFVVIADQGRGFDPRTIRTSASTGLSGMHERTVLLGRSLTIDAALGAGTRVTAALPLNSGVALSGQEH